MENPVFIVRYTKGGKPYVTEELSGFTSAEAAADSVSNYWKEFKEEVKINGVYGKVNFMEKSYVCCLCGKECFGWGNNPWPLNKKEDTRCCDSCNAEKVIPARIILMSKG